MTRKEILAAVSDAALDFMVYDRKADEDLPVGAIEAAIKNGEITLADIADEFRRACAYHGGLS